MSESLLNLLQQQLDNTALLATTIDGEYQALIKREPDLLNSLVQKKQTLLGQIEQQDTQIKQHLDAPLLNQPDQAELQQLLNAIKAQVVVCQEQNAINGELIEMSLRTTQHLTSVLTQAKAANSLTYDAKGIARGGSLLGKGVKA